MKKTGKILLTVASIISLVATIGIAVLGLILIIITLCGGAVITNQEFLTAVREWAEEVGNGEINETGIKWIIIGFSCAVLFGIFLVSTAIYLVATIILFKAAKQQSKGTQVAGIVFGFLTTPLGWLAVIASIISLIGMGIEEKHQQQAAQPKEEAKEEPKQVEAK